MISAIVYQKQLNKFKEKVCGDNFKVNSLKDSKIVILSDGLGSGIKASILSILTSEIANTLFENMVPLEEIVDTIASTLPVCKVRGIGYSTFTIIQIYATGKVKVVNYDNPDPIIIRNGTLFEPAYVEKISGGKKIKTSEFELQENDFIFAISDGMVHAGIGNLLDFGWGRDNIARYLNRLVHKTDDLKKIVDDLMELTYNYYGSEPGDDSSLVGLKFTEKPNMIVFTGPPLEPKMDKYYVNKVLTYNGSKILCGGTTSNIVSRITGKEIEIEFENNKSDLPPYGKMDEIDLVTEGVLTLKELNRNLSKCEKSMFEYNLGDENLDGAKKMFSMIRNSDRIKFLVGRKVNTFYHNPALPFDMSIRSSLIRDITQNLKRLGKSVEVEYC